MGKPVLFGQSSFTGTSTVVYPSEQGLLVPSPAAAFNADNPRGFGSGDCPLFLNDSTGSMPVFFGQDVAAGCVLRLSRPQLEQLCCAGSQYCSNPGPDPDPEGFSSPYLDDTGVPAFLAFQPG